MTLKPRMVGGLLMLAGFVYAMTTRMERLVSDDLVCFRRKEQMIRLKRFIGKLLTPHGFHRDENGLSK